MKTNKKHEDIFSGLQLIFWIYIPSCLRLQGWSDVKNRRLSANMLVNQYWRLFEKNIQWKLVDE